MAGRIPQDFIDGLTARVDIVEVIDSYVALRKAGREYVARCPFHEEKTPSFTVSPEKQFYHCFGCGAHGTVIGFMMEYCHLDFVDAVHELAQRVGLEVPQASGSDRARQGGESFDILQEAAHYFRRQLRDHPRGRLAVDYLKGRGVAGDIAAEFGIGYAPAGWENLSGSLGGKFGAEALAAAGLLIKRDQGGYYDRFRDRVMFPIRDVRGRVIGFGGRVIGDDTPKYLNSPETGLFHKGRELYGLYEARSSVKQLERLLVVEGYMDVVMLAQHGIRYAVATLGTATTPQHLERMFRLVPEVVFCFDGDRAGREAAWRALEQALPALRDGWQARFMFLPEGDDPDSLVRKEHREAFETRVENAITLSTFFYDTLVGRADISSIDGRARLVELGRPYLARLAPGAFRQLMIDRLAELSRLNPDALAGMLSGKQGSSRSARRTQGPQSERTVVSLVRKAISHLLRKPALAQRAVDYKRLISMETPGVGLLVEMLDLLQDNPHFTTAIVLEHWRGHEHARSLARLAREESLVPYEELDREFLEALHRLQLGYVEQQIGTLNSRSRDAWSQQEKEELTRLLQEKKSLKQLVMERSTAV
ncbi:MAG: DNA primase [Gammaproteobacteria bacterium]